ncbi:N-acetyltransferase family protein [Acinetobacter indicus]|uniref:GNAT family N-acetyltransferase n=1 Tax=Acinetobacter indicus TaxID=756892 RepID=UPI0032154DD3
MRFHLRPATEHDLAAIQAIYNPEVLQHVNTWNEQPFDLAHFQHWFQQLQKQNFPLLVAEHLDTGQIAGYADYSTFRSISGFKHTVEHSVFIDRQFSRQGLGKQLMQALIQHAQAHQVHVMVAAIDHDNSGSIALHQQLGFQHCGYMPQVGRKFGQWRDLVLMQLILDPAPEQTASTPVD